MARAPEAEVLTTPRVRGPARRLEATFPGRCLASSMAVQGADRAMAIAAQALTALVPLLLLIGVLAPADDRAAFSTFLVDRFRLTGTTAQVVTHLFARPPGGSIGVLSALLLVLSGVSLSRRLQRMYQQAWRLDRVRGIGASRDAALGLAVLLAAVSLLALARSLVDELPLHEVLGWGLSMATGLALWTTVPWLLLGRRLAWRRLLPAGALAAACCGGYAIASAVCMPRLIESYSRRYGMFGVTLALVGWLLCIAVIAVATTVIAAEWDRSPPPWARRPPTTSDPDAGAGNG
ncbi:YhjD/YihY/BrkB family envelope integrity protein [Geodermatophilus sp. SYSU D00758]